MDTNACTVCLGPDLENLLPLGRQPLSTWFRPEPQSRSPAECQELSFGYCRNCGAMQLVDRFSLDLLQRKSPDPRFNEPKAHLSKVVENLRQHGLLQVSSQVLGLTYIDEDLLHLLQANGAGGPHRYSTAQALQGAGLETVQARLMDEGVQQAIRQQHGLADLLIARFILEHAQSAAVFMDSLMSLVTPGGHILVEVPDASKMLASQNHALIWEDHFTYFTPQSLDALVRSRGCTVVSMQRHAGCYEDVLTLLLKVDLGTQCSADVFSPPNGESVAGMRAFGDGFHEKVKALHARFVHHRDGGGRLAVFGAGHHAVKYVNFYGLQALFSAAIDDNPEKLGTYLPGTDLEIIASQSLVSAGIDLCVSSLAPEADIRVLAKLGAYAKAGGRFESAFEKSGGEKC